MPRYFFDLTDGDGFHQDAIGEEFDSIHEARQHCQSLLPDIVREEMPDGDHHVVRCEIRDETGRIAYRGQVTYRGEFDPA